MIQLKSQKILKVHPLNFEKVLIELKGKLGQSSVNALLNNSSSMNPSPLPDIMEFDSLRGKRSGKKKIKIAIVMVMHCIHPLLEHSLT